MPLANYLDLPEENAWISKLASSNTKPKVEATIAPAREHLTRLQFILNNVWNDRVSPNASLPDDVILRIIMEAVDLSTTDSSTVTSWKQ